MALFPVMQDSVSMLFFTEQLKCNLVHKDSEFFVMYVLLARTVESLLAPALVLRLYWRPRLSKSRAHKAQLEQMEAERDRKFNNLDVSSASVIVS